MNDIRKSNIENLIAKIDITPTMYKNAVDKYKALANHLKDNGVNANIYPQGSFRLGTIVKPYSESDDSLYDLDMMCELIEKQKKTVSPKEVKTLVGEAIEKSGVYGEKLQKECDRCWTLKYSKDGNDMEFSMDVVPCVEESSEIIMDIINSGVSPELGKKAVAITNLEDEKYNWKQSNPLGYADWFDRINKPFLESNRYIKKMAIYENNRNIFASVEDVPSLLERSSLQKTIQVLKRHRDIFYTINKSWDKRPISAIITTLAAKISEHLPKNLDTYDLLNCIVNELQVYAELLASSQTIFESRHQNFSGIKKCNSKWEILNPVNTADNYADSWNDFHAKLFFLWVQAAKDDLIMSINFSDEKYFNSLDNSFGKTIVEKIRPAKPEVKPTIITSQTKPWRQ